MTRAVRPPKVERMQEVDLHKQELGEHCISNRQSFQGSSALPVAPELEEVWIVC